MTSLSESRESLRKPLAAHTDYSQFLDPQIQGSNVDLMIERHNEFLIVEFKGPDERASIGQNIMLRALARKSGFQVLFYEWTEGEGWILWLVSPNSIHDCQLGKGREELNAYIRAWARVRGLPW